MTRARTLIATLLAPALVVPALLATPAWAGTSKAKDPDDTEGVLDIASSKLVTKGGKAKLTAKTYEAFTAADFGDAGGFVLAMQYSPTKWRGVVIEAESGKAKGRICDVDATTGGRKRCSKKVKVRQTGNKVVATFSTKLIRPKGKGGAKSFKWYLASGVPTGHGGCALTACLDFTDTEGTKHKI